MIASFSLIVLKANTQMGWPPLQTSLIWINRRKSRRAGVINDMFTAKRAVTFPTAATSRPSLQLVH